MTTPAAGAGSRPPAPAGRPIPSARVRAFDQHDPPAPELISDCVHCGFCLPACPTYQLWGEEMDSPRGRILLMDLANKGERPLTAEMVAHFDACLGCLACVPACPSGVAYDRLIESTRQQVERRFRRPLSGRVLRAGIFAVLPHPTRLRLAGLGLLAGERVGALGWLAKAATRLPAAGALAGASALLPPGTAPSQLLRRGPAPRRALGRTRMRVGVLTGCVQRVVFPRVNDATSLVLSAFGAEVRVPPDQGCCGALEFHSGRAGAARARVRRLVRAFEDPGLDRIAVNAAGCGALLRDLGALFGDDPEWGPRAAAVSAKVRDVSEILDELGPPAQLRPLELKVAYHDACHLAHAQGVRDAPRRLLRAIPGLQLLEIVEGDLCCGSAGTYNLTAPEAAGDLGRRKAEHVLASGADCLAAGNPGCLLQIGSSLRALGTDLPTLHPVELLAASLGVPLPAARGRGGASVG